MRSDLLVPHAGSVFCMIVVWRGRFANNYGWVLDGEMIFSKVPFGYIDLHLEGYAIPPPPGLGFD